MSLEPISTSRKAYRAQRERFRKRLCSFLSKSNQMHAIFGADVYVVVRYRGKYSTYSSKPYIRGQWPPAIEETSLWHLDYWHSGHNHEPTDRSSAHVAHRAIDQSTKQEIQRYASVGTHPRSILAAIKDCNEESSLVLRDVYNSIASERKAELHGANIAEALIQKLEKSEDYFWHYTTDDSGHMEDLFLAHRRQIQIFKQNHDVLILDCTYKTNKYGIPLLNMVAVTGQNTSIQLGVAFLTSENETHYTWAMALLKQLLDKEQITYPRIFFTDQEQALINAIEIIFPSSSTVLCLWHIMKNIATYAKKHGNKMADVEQFDFNRAGRRVNIQHLETEEFIYFMQAFRDCVYAQDEVDFNKHRELLHQLSHNVASYIDSQYLDIWKHKIARCYTKQLRLYGIQSTSRAEGSHQTMKSWLRTCRADIYTFHALLDKLWNQQADQHAQAVSTATMTVAISLQTPFFAAVNKVIFNWPLQQTLKQWEKRNEQDACSGQYNISNGMPCKHFIQQLLVQNEILRPEHFDSHWFIHRDRAPQQILPRPILPPLSVRDIRAQRAQQNSHQQGRGVTGNRRRPSAFEVVTWRLPPPLLRPPTLSASPAQPAPQAQRQTQEQRIELARRAARQLVRDRLSEKGL